MSEKQWRLQSIDCIQSYEEEKKRSKEKEEKGEGRGMGGRREIGKRERRGSEEERKRSEKRRGVGKETRRAKARGHPVITKRALSHLTHHRLPFSDWVFEMRSFSRLL